MLSILRVIALPDDLIIDVNTGTFVHVLMYFTEWCFDRVLNLSSQPELISPRT